MGHPSLSKSDTVTGDLGIAIRLYQSEKLGNSRALEVSFLSCPTVILFNLTQEYFILPLLIMEHEAFTLGRNTLPSPSTMLRPRPSVVTSTLSTDWNPV